MALISADGRLFSMWRRAADHRRDDALALLRQVGMAAQADRPCSMLAYGDVKRVELAIAMANRPKLLLMDEPTAGMAPQERNDLMALTKQLVVDRGLAVHRPRRRERDHRVVGRLPCRVRRGRQFERLLAVLVGHLVVLREMLADGRGVRLATGVELEQSLEREAADRPWG
jgi:hypothetical protein